MANTKVTVTFDAEKLAAIRQFEGKDAGDVESVLRDQLEKIYAKTVPVAVRQYIDFPPSEVQGGDDTWQE